MFSQYEKVNLVEFPTICGQHFSQSLDGSGTQKILPRSSFNSNTDLKFPDRFLLPSCICSKNAYLAGLDLVIVSELCKQMRL